MHLAGDAPALSKFFLSPWDTFLFVVGRRHFFLHLQCNHFSKCKFSGSKGIPRSTLQNCWQKMQWEKWALCPPSWAKFLFGERNRVENVSASHKLRIHSYSATRANISVSESPTQLLGRWPLHTSIYIAERGSCKVVSHDAGTGWRQWAGVKRARKEPSFLVPRGVASAEMHEKSTKKWLRELSSRQSSADKRAYECDADKCFGCWELSSLKTTREKNHGLEL